MSTDLQPIATNQVQDKITLLPYLKASAKVKSGITIGQDGMRAFDLGELTENVLEAKMILFKAVYGEDADNFSYKRFNELCQPIVEANVVNLKYFDEIVSGFDEKMEQNG